MLGHQLPRIGQRRDRLTPQNSRVRVAEARHELIEHRLGFTEVAASGKGRGFAEHRRRRVVTSIRRVLVAQPIEDLIECRERLVVAIELAQHAADIDGRDDVAPGRQRP